MDVLDIIKSFPGPAAELDREGEVVSANQRGLDLMDSLRMGGACAKDFAILLARANLEKTSIIGRVSLRLSAGLGSLADNGQILSDPGAGPKSFDLTLLPGRTSGTNHLMLARDVTAEANLTAALTASRELYRDLVACSSDFAWETDVQGAFVYVSRRGALGYKASKLNGVEASSMLLDRVEESPTAQGTSPFTTADQIEDQEVRLAGKNRSEFRMLISATPLYSRKGVWRGARGVGHDITALRAKETEVARAALLEEAVAAVVGAMRNEVDPGATLLAAATATLHAIGAQVCWLHRIGPAKKFDEDERLIVQTKSHQSSEPGAKTPALPKPKALLSYLNEAAAKKDRRLGVYVEKWNFLSVLTEYQGDVNGALTIGKPFKDGPWDDEAANLLQNIGLHTGIAVAQVGYIENLSELSRKDSLTGALNRRAFMLEVEKRHAQHIRHGREASFLFIDIDKFKNINDKGGHLEGDRILTEVATMLSAHVRQGDFVVRFGGDEFGVWLEKTSQANAEIKIAKFFDLKNKIRVCKPLSGQVGLSVGLATLDPNSNESLDGLIARADQALYEAKESGRDTWRAAPTYRLSDNKRNSEVA